MKTILLVLFMPIICHSQISKVDSVRQLVKHGVFYHNTYKEAPPRMIYRRVKSDSTSAITDGRDFVEADMIGSPRRKCHLKYKHWEWGKYRGVFECGQEISKGKLWAIDMVHILKNGKPHMIY